MKNWQVIALGNEKRLLGFIKKTQEYKQVLIQ